ncbi:SapC family protein [Pseudoxanthomonas dokdonensis]|uniref:Peptide ABC transporter permease n=1 Tax=Pseudoxanthomonas dokdonensis TaxID=344882 RepID=A0A0R0CWG1_9GAMM|nr:SapC family protein [Pseudoxanthomonas dokdonensis]KRG69667.1 peptide ABC transporter permease [Pseudoxanthomonas dokdonensis]
MARYELLNNVAHKDLRVITRFGHELGDQLAVLPAFPSEYAELQREYPIFLRRHRDSGEWQSVALLGFERDENLFLQGDRWNASYLPGAVAKGPFLIGFQEQQVDGELRQEPVIHVDLDHPRASFSEGEAVFTAQGGHSAYLQHVISVLRGIRDGTEMTQPMLAALDACGLIQPFAIDVQLDETHRVNVGGLYGIDRDKLAALDAQALHQLHQAGYLEGVYLMLASMHNVRRLMAEKQRRLRQQQAIADTAEQAP